MEGMIQLLERNRRDFMVLIVGVFFFCLFLYFFYKEINILPLKSITVVERMSIAIVVSFVVGKLLYLIGNVVSSFLVFVLFQDDKDKFAVKWWKDLFKLLSYGTQPVEIDKTLILNADLYEYLDRNVTAKLDLERKQLMYIFWVTFLGGSIGMFSFAAYYLMSLYFPGSVLAVALIASIFSEKDLSESVLDIVKKVAREPAPN